MPFEEHLKMGQIGESEIARYLISRGWMVLPAYEIEISSGKGPRLFTVNGQLITPDALVFNAKQVSWVEMKMKSAFTWYRIGHCWQDGIDKRHWEDYCKVADKTSWPVWIMFLHRPGGIAKDTPPSLMPPTGLWGQSIRRLREGIDHESDRHANGMVYWNLSVFKKLSDYPLGVSDE